MKKTLLLSVVASTMIMAGGDIAPVEPVVETPAPVAAASGWDFSGTGVVYYQTDDSGFISGNGTDDSLFAQGSSSANAGIQLRATNADLFAGVGAGVELSGLATLGLQEDVVSSVMQKANSSENHFRGGWISQAYLTYAMGNTSFKVGRQTLPKSLSPFAYSESWNVMHNTFDAALVVNTDLADTTLVGAWVKANNANFQTSDMSMFPDLNDANGENGVFMLTAQNKSIEGLTLTGSWYYASEFLTTDDLNILWGDAQFNIAEFNVGVQGGTIMHDYLDNNGGNTNAFGAKLGATFSGINAMVAYANVNDSALGMFQVGGTTSALYTDLASDQLLNLPLAGVTRNDMSKFVVKGDMDALGGNISAAYGYADYDAADAQLSELNLAYSTNLTDSVNLTAVYVFLSPDEGDDVNLVRVVGSYNF